MIRENREEHGAVTLIEATIVFPIVFFCIIIIMFIGNMYYSSAYMQNVATEYAKVSARYLANDTLCQINSDGGNYMLDGHNINPYAQVFGANEATEAFLESSVKKAAKSSANTLFATMKPTAVKGAENGSFVNVKNGFFGKKVVIEINYEVSLVSGFRFLEDLPSVSYKIKAEETAVDSPELIRNIDMLYDFYEDFSRSDAGDKFIEKIGSAFDKVSELLRTLKK